MSKQLDRLEKLLEKVESSGYGVDDLHAQINAGFVFLKLAPALISVAREGVEARDEWIESGGSCCPRVGRCASCALDAAIEEALGDSDG